MDTSKNQQHFIDVRGPSLPTHKQNTETSVIALFRRYPYWLGLIPQIVMLATAFCTLIYGFWGLILPITFLAALNISIQIEFHKKRKWALSQDDHLYSKERIEVYRKPRLPKSFSREEEQALLKSKYFDGIVYLFHFLHFLIFFIMLAAIVVNQELWLAIALGILTPVITAPSAESFSHEFIHRKSLIEQMIGGAVWASYCYGTFLSEHPMGHHVKVSTPEDASPAPKGMTIYQFLPQAIRGNVKAGFKLESKRLANRDKPTVSLHNRILWLTLLSIGLAICAYLFAGVIGLVFFLLQSLLGVLVIETANYVMHYGLQRKKLANGKYERVSPLHSWNREGYECFFTLNLTRHSDHHAFPRRPYPVLRHFNESPELPISYEMCAYTAYFPKLWFKVMNPAVDDVMNKLAEWQDKGIDDYKRVMES